MKITKNQDYGGKHYVLCVVGTNGFIVTVYPRQELIMKKLQIILDLDDGPVASKYYDEKSDRLLTDIDVVDNDVYIQKLNNEVRDLYSSYYKINYNNEPVYFDREQEKR